MSLTFQPMRVATGFEEEGMLVLDEQRRLVAVLTHLSDQYDEKSGHWYLEAGFGPLLDRSNHSTFMDLNAAQEWIGQRLAGWGSSGIPSMTDSKGIQLQTERGKPQVG